MKKLLNFAVNTKNGQKIFLTSNLIMIISLVIGIFMIALGEKYSVVSWMHIIAPYLIYPFFGYAALMLFLFIPYLWYVGNSDKYKGGARRIMKGMSIFCSIVPGGFIYSFIAKALFIPSGLHDIAGMLLCGLFYLWIMKIIFRKKFEVVETFIPLC